MGQSFQHDNYNLHPSVKFAVPSSVQPDSEVYITGIIVEPDCKVWGTIWSSLQHGGTFNFVARWQRTRTLWIPYAKNIWHNYMLIIYYYAVKLRHWSWVYICIPSFRAIYSNFRSMLSGNDWTQLLKWNPQFVWKIFAYCIFDYMSMFLFK